MNAFSLIFLVAAVFLSLASAVSVVAPLHESIENLKLEESEYESSKFTSLIYVLTPLILSCLFLILFLLLSLSTRSQSNSWKNLFSFVFFCFYYFTAERGDRFRRVTCDLASISLPWGSANHSFCAANCLAMLKGYKGGRCIDGVCHCRK